MALTKVQEENAKKNRKYWRDREDEALAKYKKSEAEYDKEIERIYADMLDNCNAQINTFYGKYAKAEGISIAEAKKRVKTADIKEFERKAARYVRDASLDRKANGGKTNKQGYYFSPKVEEEMRLYNLTMKVNRLEMLKANIGVELIKGHDELDKFMGEILQGRTEEELKRQAGMLGKTIRNNAKFAHTIPNGSFHNATFSDRIWQYQDLMREDLSKILSSGLIQGKNPRAIAKDLKKYWYGNDPKTKGGAVYCMERLMRTEMARVQTEAQKQSFEKNGFTEYEFIANHDCCDICKEKDGKHFKVSEMMPGENAAPMHPHCRCSTAAYEASDEYEAWLDHLDKGGTTAEWNKFKKGLENSGKSGIMGLSKASASFVNHKELLYRNAQKVQKLDNFDDIVCHGTPDLFQIDMVGNDNEEDFYNMTPKEFAERIRKSNGYVGGDIRLISCQTGAKENGAAQKLANELGVKVYAPTEIVNIDEDGNMFVSDNELLAQMWYDSTTEARKGFRETGKWVLFKPGKE